MAQWICPYPDIMAVDYQQTAYSSPACFSKRTRSQNNSCRVYPKGSVSTQLPKSLNLVISPAIPSIVCVSITDYQYDPHLKNLKILSIIDTDNLDYQLVGEATFSHAASSFTCIISPTFNGRSLVFGSRYLFLRAIRYLNKENSSHRKGYFCVHPQLMSLKYKLSVTISQDQIKSFIAGPTESIFKYVSLILMEAAEKLVRSLPKLMHLLNGVRSNLINLILNKQNQDRRVNSAKDIRSTGLGVGISHFSFDFLKAQSMTSSLQRDMKSGSLSKKRMSVEEQKSMSEMLIQYKQKVETPLSQLYGDQQKNKIKPAQILDLNKCNKIIEDYLGQYKTSQLYHNVSSSQSVETSLSYLHKLLHTLVQKIPDDVALDNQTNFNTIKIEKQLSSWETIARTKCSELSMATVTYCLTSYLYNFKSKTTKRLVKKVCKPQLIKILHEIEIVKELRNAHIAQIPKFYLCSDPNKPYYGYSLFMEYVSSVTFWDYLDCFYLTTPLATKLQFVWKIVMGLRSLRDRGIVHMDAKPNNILIKRSHDISIIDFGESQSVHNPLPRHLFYRSGITTYFSAPQNYIQFDRDFCEKRDVFTVGCLLYFVMTNRILLRSIRDPEYQYISGRYFSLIKQCAQGASAIGDQQLMNVLQSLTLKCLQVDAAYRPELDWIALTLYSIVNSLTQY